jgi:endonuclease III-like uncharacterized protein
MAARHGILSERAGYEEFRALFERALATAPRILTSTSDFASRGSASHTPSRMSLARRTPLAQVFNEMHGLVVSAGKQYCLKSKAQCEQCPLGPLLPQDNSPRI